MKIRKLATAVFVTIVMGTMFGPSAVSARETKPTVKDICLQEQQAAVNEGIADFTCSASAPGSGIVTHNNRSRRVQVSIKGDDTEVRRFDVSIDVAEGVIPSVTASAVVSYPLACKTSVCTVTLTNSISLGAFGYTCAKMTYKQVYDVYLPWRALLNVRTPVINSNASYPCSEQGRNTWTNPNSMPWWAESGADITWNQSILLYGIGTIRTWHRTLGAHFDGLYNYYWIS